MGKRSCVEDCTKCNGTGIIDVIGDYGVAPSYKECNGTGKVVNVYETYTFGIQETHPYELK